MMKKMSFSKGLTILTLGLVVAGCSKMDDAYRPLSDEEAVAHAEEVLNMEIDPNQDWNMTRNGSITVTADAGINTTEVLILDAYPFGKSDAKILGQAEATEGQTVTVDYVAPMGQEYVYVACRNAQNAYRVVYSAIDVDKVSFKQQTPRRAPVASPSVTEVGSTFNSKICQSWDGVIAVENNFDNPISTFFFMGNYVPWKEAGWTDKFYQINASVADSDRPDQELSDIAEAIMRVIPEGKNNLDKANETGYSIVTTGGPVTLAPIFHNSNSGDQISYYYYPQGTTPNVKSLKKFIVGNMADPEVTNTNNYSFNKKVYNLVYEDASGNVSYDFPEGYVINFIITNTWVGNGNVEIYQSGGETISNNNSSGAGGLVPGDQVFKYALTENKSFFCGEYAVGGPYDSYFVRMGNGGQEDWSSNRNENYPDFIAAKSDSNAPEGYSAYTEGNGNNGSLSQLGTTVYYLKYTYNNSDGLGRDDDEFMARVGIVINATTSDKTVPLYVMELNDKNDTQGTPVAGFNGKTYPEKTKEVIEFRIKQGKTYAIYATGSKLGFYGCEVLYENSKRNNNNAESSSTTTTEIVKTSIPNNPEYYGDGAYNTAIHSSGISQWNLDASLAATPHAAVFSVNGKNYVGFEDWKDLDFNDVIFEITGTEGGEEIEVDDVERPVYSYAFEDTNGGDYDMNDVVIRAQESQDGGKVVLKVVAAGATLDLNLRLYPNAGDDGMTYGSTYQVLSYNNKTEIHEMFGAEHGYMINTNGGDANCVWAPVFKIEINKADYGITDASKLRLAIYSPQHDNEMRLSGSGDMPFGLIVPGNWKWPKEYINIKRAYSNTNTNEAEADQSFENYGSNAGHAMWWFYYPNEELVMDENTSDQ